jgi:uncharacterized heparinase superfamily protein
MDNATDHYWSKARLYAQTLRYLRPSQVLWRLWYRVQPGRTSIPRATVDHVQPLRLVETIRETGEAQPGCFEYFGVPRGWRDPAAIAWSDASVSRLWRFQLHGFDWSARPACAGHDEYVRKSIEGWLSQFGTRHDRDAWNPYPTAHRVVSWLKWSTLNDTTVAGLDAAVSSHAAFLWRHLERDIGGNHLVKNLKAVLFAATYLSDSRLHGQAARMLRRELRRQILPDGGHYELSPMYHAVVLEDVLDVINLLANNPMPNAAAAGLLEDARAAAPRMLGWLRAVCFGDPVDAHFNDSAPEGSASVCQLTAYAERLGLPVPAAVSAPVTSLPASGYFVIRTGELQMCMDAGRLCPDELPAHAHSDVLSFELTARGEKVFVNAGVDDYGRTDTRSYVRGAAAHNTISIDGLDQGQMWGQFRVAERPRSVEGLAGERDGWFVAEGRHDGFARQGSSAHTHARKIRVRKDGRLAVIEDEAFGSGFHLVTAYLHLHPSVGIARGRDMVTLTAGPSQIGLTWENTALATIEEHPYFEAFGVARPHQVLVFQCTVELPHAQRFTLKFE